MTTPGTRTLRPEDELSHYRIVSALGAGGMGEVYLAQDRTLERNVAIKVLPADLVRSEERVRRFVLEAKSASSLSHPNIVTIYEIGQDAVRSPGEPPSSPVHYISMELVSGKTLATHIHEDRTDLRTLIGYLAQAADGVAKAHAAGIVHRDLKPGNIMVSADGFAKVLDFGLAKLTERREGDLDVSTAPTMAAEPTAEGVVVGTAGYMSPEQVRGRSVDHRSDIFAFGCILYEAAARRRPFTAESGIETMHKILHDQPPALEELSPKAPAELRRLIRRCLQKNPDQRLQSMKDLALELREIADEYDALSASASSGTVAGTAALSAPASKRRPSPVAVGAIAVAAIAVAAGGWWLLQRGGAGSGPAVRGDMRISTQTNVGNVLGAALSADGRYLAYLAGSAGQAALRVQQVATGSDVEVLPPSTNGIESPAFTPDGNYVYYLMRKPDAPNYRTLFRMPSLGGAPQEVAFDVDSRATFSPDGGQLAFVRGIAGQGEAHLVVLDLAAGKERVLAVLKNPEQFTSDPSWSSDGTQIALATIVLGADLRSNIVLFDPKAGRRRDFLTLPLTQLASLDWLRDGKGLVVGRFDLRSAPSTHLAVVSYPGRQVLRLTHDFSNYGSVSASGGDEAVAAVRQSQLENLWIADASGSPARRITAATSPENSPGGLAPLDSQSVLFGAPRDGMLQLWAQDRQGGTARPLTSASAHSFGGSAARGRVVFNRVDASGIHVWTMNADGTGARQLTTGTGEQTIGPRTLSPDGRFVVFRRFETPNALWMQPTDTGEARELPGPGTGFLGFSADAQRMVTGRMVTDAGGISRTLWMVHSVESGAPLDSLRLPDGAVQAAWTADERGILFAHQADPVRNLHRQAFGGGAPVPVTGFREGRVVQYLVAQDGGRLAVVHRGGGSSDIWIMEPDGSRPVRAAHFDTEEVFELQWLRDGRTLVIGAGARSSDAVLVRNFR